MTRRADGDAGDRASGENRRRRGTGATGIRPKLPPALAAIVEKRERVTILPNDTGGRRRHPLPERARRNLGAALTAQLATLSNGLRIVTDRIETVATVSLGLWVDVGTRHRTAKGQRRRPFPRAHGVQGHKAAQRARHRRGDRGGRRPPQRPNLARKHRLLRQGAEGGCRPRARHPRRHPQHSTFEPQELERGTPSSCRRSNRPTTRPTTSSSIISRSAPSPTRRWEGRCSAVPRSSESCRARRSSPICADHYDASRMVLSASGEAPRPRPRCRARRQAAVGDARRRSPPGVRRDGALRQY